MPSFPVLITVVAMGAFLTCYVRQTFLADQVKHALHDRHRALWLSLRRKLGFQQLVVLTLAWRRLDRDLGDADLTRRILQLRRLYALGFCIWLAMMLVIGSQNHFRP